jgi:hypothetical protein
MEPPFGIGRARIARTEKPTSMDGHDSPVKKLLGGFRLRQHLRRLLAAAVTSKRASPGASVLSPDRCWVGAWKASRSTAVLWV